MAAINPAAEDSLKQAVDAVAVCFGLLAVREASLQAFTHGSACDGTSAASAPAAEEQEGMARGGSAESPSSTTANGCSDEALLRDCARVLWSQLSPIGFCFLTLVFRHQRTPSMLALARQLLVGAGATPERVGSEDSGSDCAEECPPESPGDSIGDDSGRAAAAAPQAVNGSSGTGDAQETSEASEAAALLTRFLEETDEAERGVAARAYLRRALTVDEPTLFRYSGDAGDADVKGVNGGAQKRDIQYLDKKCHAVWERLGEFLPASPDILARQQRGRAQGGNPADEGVPSERERALADHPLVVAMRDVLRSESSSFNLFENPDARCVLSLSGGVDSIVHACLLGILKPEFVGKFCALHIRHSNREEQAEEEQWVANLCARMGIPLYTYHVELSRPHGTVKTGLSREAYEEETKNIRFRMYERCFEKMARSACRGSGESEAGAGFAGAGERGRASTAGANFVMIGHHLDDVDENRLAELGKGNMVHIDGVSKWITLQTQTSQTLQTGGTEGPEGSRKEGGSGVPSANSALHLYRPLLGTRKAALFAYAEELQLCYMRDSTPYWSRRGWIRRTLDWYADNLPAGEGGGSDAGEGQGVRGSCGGAESGASASTTDRGAPERDPACLHACLTPLHASLERAGRLSGRFGDRMDATVRDWLATSIVLLPARPAGSAGGAQDPAEGPAGSLRRLAGIASGLGFPAFLLIELGPLVQLADDFGDDLATLQAEVGSVADVWNTATAIYAALFPQDTCPIQRIPFGGTGDGNATSTSKSAAAASTASTTFSAAAKSESRAAEQRQEDGPAQAPKQKRNRATAQQQDVAGGHLGAGPFLFTRAFYAAQTRAPLRDFLRGEAVGECVGALSSTTSGAHASGQEADDGAPRRHDAAAGATAAVTATWSRQPGADISVGRKSLHHCWQSCAKSRPNARYIVGALHQSVAYIYVRKARTLVLALTSDGSADALQRFVAAADDIWAPLGTA